MKIAPVAACKLTLNKTIITRFTHATTSDNFFTTIVTSSVFGMAR